MLDKQKIISEKLLELCKDEKIIISGVDWFDIYDEERNLLMSIEEVSKDGFDRIKFYSRSKNDL